MKAKKKTRKIRRYIFKGIFENKGNRFSEAKQ